MKTSTRFRNENGSALIVVVLFTAILLASSGAMLTLSRYSMAMSGRLKDDASVLTLAEAGVGDLLGRYGHNYTLLIGSSVATNFGGNAGGYRATATIGPGGGIPTILINSVGFIGDNERETAMELLFTRNFHGAILAGGNIQFSDGAGLIKGDIHANGDIYNTSGASKKVDGSASACGTVGGVGATNTLPGHPLVPIPDYKPFDPYEAQADEILTGPIVFGQNSDTVVSGTGLMYVHGDVTFNRRSTFKGHLVASGTISIGNNFTYEPASINLYPFAMLAGSDISMGQLGQGFYGDLWAGRDIQVDNNTGIDGHLIAVGNVSVGNRLIITALPPNMDESELIPVIGGWVK